MPGPGTPVTERYQSLMATTLGVLGLDPSDHHRVNFDTGAITPAAVETK